MVVTITTTPHLAAISAFSITLREGLPLQVLINDNDCVGNV